MFNSLLVASAVLMILGSGLVSCSPDNDKTKVVDNFRAQPPKILRGDKEVQITKENASALATIDLQDRFDFRKSGGDRVLIAATCSRAGTNTVFETAFPAETPIPFYRIIRPDFLVDDLKKVDVRCSLEMTVVKGGSQHILPIAPMRVSDEREPAVRVSRDTESEQPMTVGKLNGIIVRSKSQSYFRAKLICKDLALNMVDFSGSMSLETFDFGNPLPVDPANPSAYLHKPRQECRILITGRDQIEEISALLDITFGLRPLQIESLPGSKAPDVYLEGGAGFTIATLRVTNPEPVERFVRLPNVRFNAYSVLFGRYQSLDYKLHPAVMKTLVPGHVQFEVFAPRADVNQRDLLIPPSGTLLINLRFTYFNMPTSCIATPVAHTLQIADAVVIESVTAQGLVDGKLSVNSFPEFWAYKAKDWQPEIAAPLPGAPPTCTWR